MHFDWTKRFCLLIKMKHSMVNIVFDMIILPIIMFIALNANPSHTTYPYINVFAFKWLGRVSDNFFSIETNYKHLLNISNMLDCNRKLIFISTPPVIKQYQFILFHLRIYQETIELWRSSFIAIQRILLSVAIHQLAVFI